MLPYSAAPGGGTPGHRYIDGSASSLSRLGLSETIIQRLASEGITTLDEWLALTPRQRRSIWGVTIAHVRLLDRLAREVRT